MVERRFWAEFEDLISRLLTAEGYETELRIRSSHGPRDRVREIDIVARNADGTVLPVEVKLGARKSVTLSMLRDASSVAGSLKDFAVKTKPLLVYGAYIEPSRREWAEHEFQIQIWDRDILLRRAGLQRPELDRFFQEYVQQLPKPSDTLPAISMVSPAPELVEPVSEPQPKPQGDALIAQLAHVAPGKKDAKA